MLKHILLILISFVFLETLAQKEDRIWIFGDHGGIDFNDTGNVFSFYSPLQGTIVKYTIASISDKGGDLLFYAAADRFAFQGVYVYNRTGALMQNGDSLEGHPAQTQGLLILPFPGDSLHYYIFSKMQHNSQINLYYTVVDMSLDGGLGGVVQKNIRLTTDSITQRLTAVKHANGRDWWLIQQRWDQDEYLVYLISPSGIQGPSRQAVGTPDSKYMTVGQSRFSRSGERFVSVSPNCQIDLLDFDRCSGMFSNYRRIGKYVFSPENSYLGCEFSPDEQILYVANSYPYPAKFVYQYDLNAPDIRASKQTIMMYPDTGILQNVQMASLQLGADDKLYVSKGNGSGPNSNTVYTQNIDVILNPNVLGPGCDYSTNHMYLNGGRTTYSLPNMVNYALGPVQGSICDTLSTGLQEIKSRISPFSITPNPVKEWINIYHKEDFTGAKEYLAQIINSQGQVVFEKTMSPNEHYISSSYLSEGVYILRLKTKKGQFMERFVKM